MEEYGIRQAHDQGGFSVALDLVLRGTGQSRPCQNRKTVKSLGFDKPHLRWPAMCEAMSPRRTAVIVRVNVGAFKVYTIQTCRIDQALY